ncbi:unnamed protein product [Microthlaspi erraticum]|uniref:Reverse transcriptase zinc-binding domain-containing protein n=1 Tax=Microthlaspi erraticum TaxID=1685480 RepID=A0A6D2KY07_9BRAS|nr:unnamed protein product [Microthlaspi erraticum]
MWRSVANCLAVATNMSKKRLTKCKQCPRCGAKEEDANHVLFVCPYASSLSTSTTGKKGNYQRECMLDPGSYGEYGSHIMTSASKARTYRLKKLQNKPSKIQESGWSIKRRLINPSQQQVDHPLNGYRLTKALLNVMSMHPGRQAVAAALVWAMAVVDNLGFSESYIGEIRGTQRFLKPTFKFCRREANEAADPLAKSSLSNPMYLAFLDCSIHAWLSRLLDKEKQCITL